MKQNANILRINSVSTLPAQTNKLLHKGSNKESEQRVIIDKLRQNKAYLGKYYYLFLLMFYNGTRISETLNLDHDKITSAGHVYLVSSKGSENRLIYAPECEQFLLKARKKFTNPFFGCNRFTAYRMLRNLGIGIRKKGRKHDSVTHIFRNLHAANLRQIGLEGQQLSKITGHKNPTNTDYYGKD